MKFTKLIILLLFCQLGYTETFCVNNLVELQTALNIAGSNHEADVIRLKPGTYTAVNNSPITFNADFNTELFSLHISGGWTDAGPNQCVFQSHNSQATVLSGNHSQRVLEISTSGPTADITIANLTIANGHTTTQSALGALQMNFGSWYAGEVLIDRVYFADNYGFAGSAMHIYTGHEQAAKFTIRNSVFALNTTVAGAGVCLLNFSGTTDTQFYFINNTMIMNVSESLDPNDTSGLQVHVNSSQDPRVLLANNVFWLNSDNDFKISSNSSPNGQNYLYNNSYGDGVGQFADQANNITGNPMLDTDFTPLFGSALIDRGNAPDELPVSTPFLQDWDYGTKSFSDLPLGRSRVINGRVDIGAVEAPSEVPIFQNGFE